jgi:hypothetical protein
MPSNSTLTTRVGQISPAQHLRVVSDELDDQKLIARWLALEPVERNKEFWTVDKFANHFDITKGRVRQLSSDGKLVSVKVLGRIYIYMPSSLALIRGKGNV